MKYVSITSARSHPDKNPKVTRNEQLEKYYLLDTQYKIPTYFISFTKEMSPTKNDKAVKQRSPKLSKLGINPQSVYDTPLGIYTYPLRWRIQQALKGHKAKKEEGGIEFAGNTEYIQVVERVTDKVLYKETFSKSDYTNGIKTLKNLYIKNKTSNKINTTYIEHLYLSSKNLDAVISFDQIPDKEIFKIIEERVEKEYESLAKATHGESKILIAKFWLFTQEYADIFTIGQRQTVGSKKGQVWRTLLVKLGYEVVIDDGDGFIHPNEPCQAVFFTKKALKHIDTIFNKKNLYKDSNKPKELKKFINLTEKSYNRLLRINPCLNDIKGYGIYVSLDEKSNRITLSSGMRDYKGKEDSSKAFISSKKPIKNCIINITCKNTTLENCTILQSYCENSTITNCKYISLYADNSTLMNCQGQSLTYISSNISDSTAQQLKHAISYGNGSKIENCVIGSLSLSNDDIFTTCNINQIVGTNEYSTFNNCKINIVKPMITVLENCSFENCSWGSKIDFSNPLYKNYTSKEAQSAESAIFINCKIQGFYQELVEINNEVLKLKESPDIDLSAKKGKVVINKGDISNLSLNDFIIRYPEISNCTITDSIFESTGMEGNLFVTHSTLDRCTLKFAYGGIIDTKFINCNISYGYFYTGNIIENSVISGGFFYNIYKNHKNIDPKFFYDEPKVIFRNCTISPNSRMVFERAKFINCDLSDVNTNDSEMFIQCKFE